MKPIQYRVVHAISQSVTMIDFAWIDNQIKLTNVKSLQGNVIDLTKYRNYKKHAYKSFIAELDAEITATLE